MEDGEETGVVAVSSSSDLLPELSWAKMTTLDGIESIVRQHHGAIRKTSIPEMKPLV